MDVYITEKGGGRLGLAMPPEKIACSFGVTFQSYTMISGDDVQLPKGEALSAFRWDGTLPGASRRNASFIRRELWENPAEILDTWERWRKKRPRLRLMVTETPINHDVYLDTYDAEYSGGNGDCAYSISFVAAKAVEIGTASEYVNVVKTSSATSRPPAASSGAKTHTVKKGDALWAIAQQYLGNGSRYDEIYKLNKAMMDSRNQGAGNPIYTIYPGQVLILPG